MSYCFSQWRAQNAMSVPFQLSELSRQFQIDYIVDGDTVLFSGGLGPVADELRDKTFVLGSWEELYDGEIFENDPNDWNDDEYLPGDPDGLIEQASELRDEHEEDDDMYCGVHESQR